MDRVKVESDRGRPVVRIDLDRPRKLRFDLEACRKFQSVTGVSILGAPLVFLTRHLNEGTIPEFVWAFGCHEDRDLTTQSVVDALSLDQVTPVVTAISALVIHALREANQISAAMKERMEAALYQDEDDEELEQETGPEEDEAEDPLAESSTS